MRVHFPRIRYGTLADNSKNLGARTWSRERAICPGDAWARGTVQPTPNERYDPSTSLCTATFF